MSERKRSTKTSGPLDAFWRLEMKRRADQLGLRPKNLAELAQIPHTTVNSILRHAEPAVGAFSKLSNALGVSMDELYFGSKTRKSFPQGTPHSIEFVVGPDGWKSVHKTGADKVVLPLTLAPGRRVGLVGKSWGSYKRGDILITHRSVGRAALASNNKREALVLMEDGRAVVGIAQAAPDGQVLVLQNHLPRPTILTGVPKSIEPIVMSIARSEFEIVRAHGDANPAFQARMMEEVARTQKHIQKPEAASRIAGDVEPTSPQTPTEASKKPE